MSNEQQSVTIFQIKEDDYNYNYTLKFQGFADLNENSYYKLLLPENHPPGSYITSASYFFATELYVYKNTPDNTLYVMLNIPANNNKLEKVNLELISGGGKHKYKGRTYKVRTGQRGGKYIMVGGSKIYV